MGIYRCWGSTWIQLQLRNAHLRPKCPTPFRRERQFSSKRPLVLEAVSIFYSILFFLPTSSLLNPFSRARSSQKKSSSAVLSNRIFTELWCGSCHIQSSSWNPIINNKPASVISINLKSNEGHVLLHISLRVSQNILVFNSREVNGNWGEEQREGLRNPFVAPNFSVSIGDHGDRYELQSATRDEFPTRRGSPESLRASPT